MTHINSRLSIKRLVIGLALVAIALSIGLASTGRSFGVDLTFGGVGVAAGRLRLFWQPGREGVSSGWYYWTLRSSNQDWSFSFASVHPTGVALLVPLWAIVASLALVTLWPMWQCIRPRHERGRRVLVTALVPMLLIVIDLTSATWGAGVEGFGEVIGVESGCVKIGLADVIGVAGDWDCAYWRASGFHHWWFAQYRHGPDWPGSLGRRQLHWTYVPLWPFAAVLSVPAIALWLNGLRFQGRSRCDQCGYDLNGLHGQSLCPECGQPIPAQKTINSQAVPQTSSPIPP